jgi:hypothetical protein
LVINTKHRQKKSTKKVNRLHYGVILSLVLFFGFSSSITDVWKIVKKGFTQPVIGFQTANNYSYQIANFESIKINQSEVEPSFQITDTLGITGTATIPPLPTYTLVFPETTVEPELFQTYQQPIEKQTIPQYWKTFRRFWPLLLFAMIWIILGLWFVFSQMIIK